MIKQKKLYRFERKLLVTEVSAPTIESIIKLHPALFKEIYFERWVNNIYFDFYDYKNYLLNVNGFYKRLKIRVRWYGDLFKKIERPILELKKKSGELGTKDSYPLQAFELKQNEAINLKDIFNNSNLPLEIKSMLSTVKPVLINRYQRKYYLSSCGRYRLTIDKDLDYYEITANSQRRNIRDYDGSISIVEVKYNESDDNDADSVLNKLPFRVTRSSKYVMGLSR
jgi:hypothetical protein